MLPRILGLESLGRTYLSRRPWPSFNRLEIDLPYHRPPSQENPRHPPGPSVSSPALPPLLPTDDGGWPAILACCLRISSRWAQVIHGSPCVDDSFSDVLKDLVYLKPGKLPY
ncbi:hypothetical protein VTI74DRAFT_4771 [Chaetomium olivicolor]